MYKLIKFIFYKLKDNIVFFSFYIYSYFKKIFE